MKNKYNNCQNILATILLITASFGVFPVMGNAQENEAPLFAQVDFIKVMPENGDKFIEFIKNNIKPLQFERIKQGKILGWFLYKVRFTGSGDCYNYAGVTLYPNPAAIEYPFQGIDVGKILPGKDMNKVLLEASSLREMVHSTLISRQSFAYPEGGPGDFKYLQIDYMKVETGKEDEYFDVETKIWKPVHNEFIKAGSRVGWSLWGTVFPSGTGQEFQYITVNYYADWSKIGMADYNDAFSKAHPGKDINALSERTGASRNLVKSELWEVIEKVFAQ